MTSQLNLHMPVVAAKRKQSNFKMFYYCVSCVLFVFVVVSCGQIHFVKHPPPDKDKQRGGVCFLKLSVWIRDKLGN